MSYARKLLADGERIVHAGRQHVLAVLRRCIVWLLVACAGAALLIASLGASGEGSRQVEAVTGGVILAVGLAIAGERIASWRHQEFLVTTRRVIKAQGVFRKRLAETSLEKINDARLEQSWLGRVFGYGNLDLLTAADESPLDDFPMLADPVGFQRAISNERERLLHA